MIDPMVSLAFSIYSNKGVYALLLGSGISRASGIPTGWDVVLDLIGRIAHIVGEQCDPDPATWFRNKYHSEPDYRRLLDMVAKTPTERQQLLRSYFEPKHDEHPEDQKHPSAAHRAIAELVKSGYIRVIITTNFDQLTENALEGTGIHPTIISTTDELNGALPLTHSTATIIKINGDYLDTRIKNTETELAAYDNSLNCLLDRVFDEYGLIVCGWSGEWDTALCSAIERCPSRRFSTYWSAIQLLKGGAKKLIEVRKAEVIQDKTADQLFVTLLEKVKALEDINSQHPMSAGMAVATVKRYLADPTSLIRFHDFFREETEALIKTVLNENIPDALSEELAGKVFSKFDQMSASLLSVFIASAYWGEPKHAVSIASCLERLANLTLSSNQKIPPHFRYRQYPALLMLYGAGISAVSSGKYQTLLSILTRPLVRGSLGRDEPFYAYMNPDTVIENGFGFPQKGRIYFASNYLKSRLREPFFEHIAIDRNYAQSFDRFEYLWTLIGVHYAGSEILYSSPYGWATRTNIRSQDNNIMNVVDAELEATGKDWEPLRAGLFNGCLESLMNAKTLVDERAKRQLQPVY